MLPGLKRVEGMPFAGILESVFGADSPLFRGFPFERFFEGFDDSLVSSRIRELHDLARNQNEDADGLKAGGDQADAETYYDVKMRVLRYFRLRIQADKRDAFSESRFADSVWAIEADLIKSLITDFRKESVLEQAAVIPTRNIRVPALTFKIEWKIIRYFLLHFGKDDEKLMTIVAEMDAEYASLMSFWNFFDFSGMFPVPDSFVSRMVSRVCNFHKILITVPRSSRFHFFRHQQLFNPQDEDAYLVAISDFLLARGVNTGN